MPTYPFEVSLDVILKKPDSYVDAVFSCLESEFLTMPKGEGFVDYPLFERGYEALKSATASFNDLNADKVFAIVTREPMAFIVLRSMLGFTPPEWGYLATQRTGVNVAQGFVRSLDRSIRMKPTKLLAVSDIKRARLEALIETACHLLKERVPEVNGNQFHRLDKADTKNGLDSLRHLSGMGVPYAMLLYERFLGRPFAGHRDSVSDLVGDSLESAIEDVLSKAGISYRKTKRAETIEGFDQTPDFIIPSEFNPQIIIEAKITEDDGTARDKATRIQHLGALSMAGRTEGDPKYEVIACIGGRGFGVRREDMKKMIIATRGKIFTLKTLGQMVEHTELKKYSSGGNKALR